MNEIEVAWLAGLIEGEGFLSIKRGRNPLLGVNMTDLDVLERAQSVTGAGNITIRKAEAAHHKQQWGWRVCGQVAVNEICLAIRPHMGTRRTARIDEVLALPILISHPRTVWTPEVERLAWEMRGDGCTHQEIADATGASRVTVGRMMADGRSVGR